MQRAAEVALPRRRAVPWFAYICSAPALAFAALFLCFPSLSAIVHGDRARLYQLGWQYGADLRGPG